jgi:hypothetical protein
MPKTTDKKTKAKTSQSHQELINTLEYDEQLIPISEFDPTRLLYSDPDKREIPGGKGSYRTVKLRYHYSDGKQGPVTVQLGEKWCYGIKPDNLDKDGNVRTDDDGKPQKMKNYQASMPMYNSKNGVTEEEQLEIDFLDGLHQEGQNYVVTNKKKLGCGTKSDDSVRDSVKPILFRKKKTDDEIENLDEGESPYVEDYVPALYTKLWYYNKDKVCKTVIYGPGDKPMDPRKLDYGFNLVPTLQVDTLYLGGGKASFQHKLYDGTARFKESRVVKRHAPKNAAPEEDTPDDVSGEGVTASDDESASMSSASE